MRVRMVCEAESAAENESSLQKWLAALPKSVTMPAVSQHQSEMPTTPVGNVLYDMPYKVYYSGLAMETVPFVDPNSASLSVLSQLLTHKYLHPEIREKGGAYGAGASNGPIKGIFTLSSYRDPNPTNTLNVFKKTGIFARERSWTDRELEEAKLSIFQGLDAPTSVDEEGARYFMSGVTHEMDQRWREQVLDVTAKDVNEVAARFLVGSEGSVPPRQALCVLGEKKGDLTATMFGAGSEWAVKKLSLQSQEAEVADGLDVSAASA
ncbi:hypothetical protein F66182_14080 [Fusarium sp. NRRL 66182]|nr:hypothetical protein F66182_14080 [Fusarium sp. NRRL 66182]